VCLQGALDDALSRVGVLAGASKSALESPWRPVSSCVSEYCMGTRVCRSPQSFSAPGKRKQNRFCGIGLHTTLLFRGLQERATDKTPY